MNNETKSVSQEVSHTQTPWSLSGVPGDNYIMARRINGYEKVTVWKSAAENAKKPNVHWAITRCEHCGFESTNQITECPRCYSGFLIVRHINLFPGQTPVLAL